MNKKATHLFFDLDDTVTLSRSEIDHDMHAFFASFPHDIVIISGAHVDQIHTQTRHLSVYALGQNGNQAHHPSGQVLWEEQLHDEHERTIRDHIATLQVLLAEEVRDINDLVEHRGAQISYSLIGHHEATETKKAYDPDRTKRLALLTSVPFDSEHLEVKIGGTTCFDYFLKGRHKGYNVQRLIEHEGWNASDCVYFGDAICPGGNDETVIGVVETIPVRNHRHTFEILSTHFK